MTRCFVTGADGFIGSHLCEALRDAGLEVTGMALYNAFGRYGWLDEVEGVERVMGDVRDLEILSRFDYIFHLAALIDVAYSYRSPRSYIETNVFGAMNACSLGMITGAKLIHTSSSEVYGTAQYTPQDEKHPLCAQSPYAASKIAADQMVEAYVRSYGLKAVTLRPFNTFGPRQSTRAVIGKVMHQVATGRAISLGNVDTERDFTYVTDTVAAFLAVMDLEGGVYNCGTGKTRKIRDIAAWATDGETFMTDDALRRPEASEVQLLKCDAKKLHHATGWSPKVSFEEGLELTREWHAARR